ncbi:isoprenylcysteine carboxylmethyltransferase family protein [bacterium]|nr:isoprenylcysteine carboxylmethyltransferase family protein [bacterium]
MRIPDLGKRGEGWFFLQLMLISIFVLLPGRHSAVFPTIIRYVGLMLLFLCALVILAGIIQLGSRLSPFPKPVESAEFIEDGIYRISRHPIYSAIIFGSCGWATWFEQPIAFTFTIIFYFFFNLKATVEERMLRQIFSQYDAYARRTKKLIPWL